MEEQGGNQNNNFSFWSRTLHLSILISFKAKRKYSLSSHEGIRKRRGTKAGRTGKSFSCKPEAEPDHHYKVCVCIGMGVGDGDKKNNKNNRTKGMHYILYSYWDLVTYFSSLNSQDSQDWYFQSISDVPERRMTWLRSWLMAKLGHFSNVHMVMNKILEGFFRSSIIIMPITQSPTMCPIFSNSLT